MNKCCLKRVRPEAVRLGSSSVVRALALRFGDSALKTHSAHSLNLILVIPGSTSRLHLQIVNWFASVQLGFLTVIVTVSFRWLYFTGPEKPASMGSGQLNIM